MTIEEEVLKATNKLVDFYKEEMEKYQNLYFKIKQEYELLLFDIQQQNFDNFEYRGIKLKDLYKNYIEK